MKRMLIITLILLGLLLLAAFDQVSNGYDLSWWTVDGGGGDSVGTGYSISGSIGQADASQQLTGGDYSLRGGFWVGTGGAQYDIYLPLVLR